MRWIVEPFTRAFRFVPAVLIAMIFFVGNITNQGIVPLVQQCIILALIAFFPLVTVIGEDINYYLKSEFIQAARVLGASKWWIIKQHILRYLKQRLFIYLIQQISQSLLLLIHIGAFGYIIGGLKMVDIGSVDSSREVASSLSNEWTGLIGLSYHELMLDKWIVVGPCIGFVLTMISFNLLLQGIQQITEERPIFENKF